MRKRGWGGKKSREGKGGLKRGQNVRSECGPLIWGGSYGSEVIVGEKRYATSTLTKILN